ncbi:replication initiation protein [Blautia argi]|uniref:replication initiation protein n=1 Tax=Blautia argi TaxID=1912897 RepID=UPI0029429A9F|nr:replication initiation protein [Blautia argi]
MARPVVIENSQSKEIRQSNYFTTAKYDYTLQEKLILYRIAEKAFEYREANKEWFEQNEGKYIVKEHVSFRLPITHFMTKEQQSYGGGNCYDDVVAAFKSLTSKRIEFQTKNAFSFGALLNSADREPGEGTIYFTVHKFVWQSALDFTKGFTKFDLFVAMGLKSAYSMRFYEIATRWKDTKIWQVSVEEFREIFGCKNKYPALTDMKRYIIDNAKEELDKSAPWSFTYEQYKPSRKVLSFTFYFHKTNKNIENERKELLSKYPQAVINPEIKDWFKHKMNFNQTQIRSNVKLIEELQRIFQQDTISELEETFQYISKQGFRPQENVGWFIQNLKKKVENAKK